MRIDIISAVPDLMESPFKTSILKRAMEKGLAEVHFHNVRDFAFNKHRQIDDTLYGGGAGMVMMCEPLDLCISQLKSEKYLKDLGVRFISNDRVTDYDGDRVYLSSGNIIPSNNVIWAAGVTGNIIEGLTENSIKNNRYIVDRYNKIVGFDDIYAIGDIAYMETPKYPNGHPQVANVAINQGKNLAKNFLKKSVNEWQPYEYDDKGSMATIGKHRAVVDLPKFKFQGIFAWYFWMFLHLMLILSVRNKLAIFFNWMWSYINRDSSLRLIIIPNKKNKTEQ